MKLKILDKNAGQLPDYFWIGIDYNMYLPNGSMIAFRFVGRCLTSKFGIFTAEFY
jgi:hypothetical protein